ncbi:protein translocase subunit SecD [Candidatus Contubernalis alkaliaceticus]|uniref:protein translocase subunit SecD n=1 Tax=Candidatus Contubernalis alkaliaceticus TaxID=338645 RepID=UPI001F4C453B|nr:protein translocase subunit SecD [Candidatus Contubernalis alkalaceticus]UNC92895.1 protein translocase subunit SecD [Candidatus Contubernalis alkalaceticus]
MKKKTKKGKQTARKSLSLFLGLLILLSAVSYLTYSQIQSHLKLGLDLEGGVYVLLEAREEDGEVEKDTIERAITIIRNRIDEFGVTEPVIQQEGDKRIRVELPGIDDPGRAIDIIGRTALLTFEDPQENVVLTGANLKEATFTLDRFGHPAVGLEFDGEGAAKFKEATRKLAGTGLPIYIKLDGEVVSEPRVENVIDDGNAIITGRFSAQEVNDLVLILRSGALPVELVELETRTVGSTLGRDSLDRSLRAGFIGFGLLFIFMLLVYRTIGLIASFSLGVYVALVLGILTALNATLTLPGIAGLILSVGMAVDANVIIFERFKEEFRSGRTLRSALEAGFKNALSTIMDANITTLIAAGVLFYFGTGPVRGFAVTLTVGILTSMFTAIVLTRYLLRYLIGANIITNPKLFGVRGIEDYVTSTDH